MTIKKTTKKKNNKTKNNKRVNKRKKQSKRWWLKPALFLALILGIAVGVYVFYCWLTMPDINKAIERTRLPATVILNESGQEIASYGGVYSDINYFNRRSQILFSFWV